MEGQESRMLIERWCEEEDWLTLSEKGPPQADRITIGVFGVGSKIVGEGEAITVRWPEGEDYLMLEREIPMPGREIAQIFTGREVQDLIRQEFDEMAFGWPGIVTFDLLPGAEEIVHRLGLRLYLDGLNKHTFLTAVDNLVKISHLLRAKYRRWLTLGREVRPASEPVKPTCPKCGYPSESGKRFCTRCGAPL